jgi:hypothetical protein
LKADKPVPPDAFDVREDEHDQRKGQRHPERLVAA